MRISKPSAGNGNSSASQDPQNEFDAAPNEPMSLSLALEMLVSESAGRPYLTLLLWGARPGRVPCHLH